jgi:hypothetical protein
MICLTDLLHPSPAPHLKNVQVLVKRAFFLSNFTFVMTIDARTRYRAAARQLRNSVLENRTILSLVQVVNVIVQPIIYAGAELTTSGRRC